MKHVASYIILITRRDGLYSAACPAFPELLGQERSSRRAYGQLKSQVRAKLANLMAKGEDAPNDVVITTASLRLNLLELRDEEELR